MKPGDLVMVVKPTFCCNNPTSIGKISSIANGPISSLSQCRFCGKIEPAAWDEVCLGGRTTIEARRLKLIPPLSDLKGTETKRELVEVR